MTLYEKIKAAPIEGMAEIILYSQLLACNALLKRLGFEPLSEKELQEHLEETKLEMIETLTKEE